MINTVRRIGIDKKAIEEHTKGINTVRKKIRTDIGRSIIKQEHLILSTTGNITQ